MHDTLNRQEGILHRKLILAIIAVSIAASLRAYSDSDNMLRVGLARYNNCASLSISAVSGAIITSLDGNSNLTTDSINVEPSGSSITITPSGSGQAVSSTTALVSGDNVLVLNSPKTDARKYRGSIEISMKNGKLRVVNLVDVEDYLLGVVPAEMGDSCPTEALRAQAIAARTYALCNKRKHASQGFDLCDSTHCQTYDGVAAERARCSQAISDTKGMVLTYNGKIAEVMYSSDCGGSTVNYSETHHGSNFPYLCGVIDPDDIPRITWEQTYSLQDLGSKLLAAGIKEADGLQSIVVSKTGSTGRPLEAQITGKSGSATVRIEKIRAALGFRSALFTIETVNGQVTFKGKGAGHGIGLCQRGTKGLASSPYNYTYSQILMHYFPGTVITGGIAPTETAADVAMVEQQIVKLPATAAVKPHKTTTNRQETQAEVFDVRLEAPGL